jgi:hypothetical protein
LHRHTSSLISLRLWRPRTSYPQIWKKLDTLIADKRLIAPWKVFEELKHQDDALLVWARRRKSMFRKTSKGLIEAAQQILSRFPDLVDPNQPTESADPYVVALALKEKTDEPFFSPDIVVVTEEKFAVGKTRIPRVCQEYGLLYLAVHQMFLFEKWEF